MSSYLFRDNASKLFMSQYDATLAPPKIFPRLPDLPLLPLQPVLKRIVRCIGAENPDMFNRLGPHTLARFLIDPINLPFTLLLQPDPNNLCLTAHFRAAMPNFDACISGKFLDLMQLLDSDIDGDALFFSRDLFITGNTEAVVCLRNALDDVNGSIAQMVADMFGPIGRGVLSRLRRAADSVHMKGSQ